MEVLKLDFPAPTFDGLRVLIIDEKAIRKGHGYVILVLNGVTGELLHVAEGKKKEGLEPFFEVLTKAQKACIQVVCIDRAGAYQSVVGEEVPKAAIVYDRFHLYLNLESSPIDQREHHHGLLSERADPNGVY